MLIRSCEVDGRRVDVRIVGDRVGAIAPGLAPAAGERVLDADGGALLPGLHDHHLHLFALAASLRSVRCGPPEVTDGEGLARALHAAPPREGWVRGVGYHESVAGALDRDALDAWRADVPVRLQHRSGALWMLNSAGVAALALDADTDAPGLERDARGRATGRLYRADRWLRERLGSAATPSLGAAARLLASRGVTGITDATPGNGTSELAAFAEAMRRDELPQRVVLMGARRLPAPGADAPVRLMRGAVKLVLAEDALPSLDELARRFARAHADGRAVAVHCVTRAELMVALAAFAEAGAVPGDRIEHASVAPPDCVERIAALRLTVVSQPNFLRERGDAYASEVEARDRRWLYRCRAFDEAGVPFGGGTDAPFGAPDPWAAMAAAVERRSAGGLALAPEEALAPERALALFTTPPERPGGPPRRVVPGAEADLCLLEGRWREARRDLAAVRVRASWCGGEPVEGLGLCSTAPRG